MSVALRAAFAAWVVLAGAAGGAAEGPTLPPLATPRRFSLAVRHVTLGQLAPVLSRLGGAEVTVEPEVSEREVAAVATDRTLAQLLDELCWSYDLQVRAVGQGFVLSARAAAAAPAAAASGVVTRSLVLRHAQASVVAGYFGQPSVVPTPAGQTRVALPDGPGRRAVGCLALPDGINSLVGYDLLSALVVSGQSAAIEELRKVVALLDVPRRQVECATTLVRMTRTMAATLGLDLAAARSGMASEFSGLLRSLRRMPGCVTISAPKSLVVSGEAANLDLSQEHLCGADGSTVAAGSPEAATAQRLVERTDLQLSARVAGRGANQSIVLSVTAAWHVGPPQGPRVFEATSEAALARLAAGQTLLVTLEPAAAGPDLAPDRLKAAANGIWGTAVGSPQDSLILVFVTPTEIREEGAEYTVTGR